MSNLAQFVGGYGPIATIVNYYSGGSTVSTNTVAADALNNCKAITTSAGSVSANTLKTHLSLTGRGRMNCLTAYTLDATARTVRAKVTIDGVVVFDATSAATGTSGRGIVIIGSFEGTSLAQAYQPVDFYTSFLVETASSVTEADKIALAANYETWA